MIITVLIPICSERGKSLADAALDDILQIDDAKQLPIFRDGEGRAPNFATLSALAIKARTAASDTEGRASATEPERSAAAASATERIWARIASTAPLRIEVVPVSIPLNRVCAEKATNCAWSSPTSVAAYAIFLFGQHHDGAAFRRLYPRESKLRRVGELFFTDAGQRNEFRRLPVAEGDRAGLVEKQGVDVASGFDRASYMARPSIRSADPFRRCQIADKSAPIVVGMRVTKSATRTRVGVKLAERFADRRPDDRRIEQGAHIARD